MSKKPCFLRHFQIFFNLGAILAHQTSTGMFSGSWRIFWHPWEPWVRVNSEKKFISVQTATVHQIRRQEIKSKIESGQITLNMKPFQPEVGAITCKNRPLLKGMHAHEKCMILIATWPSSTWLFLQNCVYKDLEVTFTTVPGTIHILK